MTWLPLLVAVLLVAVLLTAALLRQRRRTTRVHPDTAPDRRPSGQYQCRPWFHSGVEARRYVRDLHTGTDLGYLDLRTGTPVAFRRRDLPRLTAALAEQQQHWTDTPVDLDSPAAAAITRHHHDLRRNIPGASARAYAAAHPDQATTWLRGAEGEEAVGSELHAVLDDRWLILHDIEVGTQHANIDHLIIGPGGVFTINTKHHHRGRVTVNGDHLTVNGRDHDYIAKAEHEADRAARILSANTGFDVPVSPMLVFHQPASLTVTTPARRVRVITTDDLVTTLSDATELMSDWELAQLRDAAVQPGKWTNPPPPKWRY